MEVRILRCADLGVVIEYERGEPFTKVLRKNDGTVTIQYVLTSLLDLCADDFEYPGGVKQVVSRFLSATSVEHAALTVLEKIMTTYAINTVTNKIVGKFATEQDAERMIGENPALKTVSSPEEVAEKLTGEQMAGVLSEETQTLVSRPRDKQVGAQKVWDIAEKKGFAVVKTGNTQKRFRTIAGADFSKRRGGYRMSLDAIAGGKETLDDILSEVRKSLPDYPRAGAAVDIRQGVAHGYLEEIK